MGTKRRRQAGARLGYIISRRTLEYRPQIHISRRCERAAAGKAIVRLVGHAGGSVHKPEDILKAIMEVAR